MRYVLGSLTTLCLALASASSGTAATKHARMPTSRYMAIETCTQQAKDQYPGSGSPLADGRNRSFAYAACMTRKGLVP
jgi:hypothetical protein